MDDGLSAARAVRLLQRTPRSGPPGRGFIRLACRNAAGSLALTLGLGAGAALAEDGVVKLEFVNCTPQMERDITEAVALAATAIDQVAARLSSDKEHPADVAAIARWLGERTSRFDILKDLKYLAARLDPDQLPIVAECRPEDHNVFAWTYSAMTGEGYISFGMPFFQAPLVGGPDTRMGTVIHELSHMVPGIATEDYFYADHQIQGLARIFPDAARDNAQNIEYLVEEIFDRLNGTTPGVKFIACSAYPGAHPPPVDRNRY